MFKAITMILMAVAVLSLGACAEKKKCCTTTKVSTVDSKSVRR